MLWDSAESCRKRQVSGHCDELFLGQTALYKVKNKEQMSRVSFLWKMSIFLKPASFCKSDFTSKTLVQLLVRENQLISNAGRQGLYGLQYLLPLTTSVQLIPVIIIIIIIICALLVMSVCLPAWATLLLMPAFTLIQSHVLHVSRTRSSVSSVTLTAFFMEVCVCNVGCVVCWTEVQHEFDLCLCVGCLPKQQPSQIRAALCADSRTIRWIQDLSTTFPFPPFLSYSSWVVIPPVDQQVGAFLHQTTAQLEQDWTTVSYTKHQEELWCLCSQTLP